MERWWSLEEVGRDSRHVVTIGTFDGVHVGHQAILSFLAERSAERGGPSALITFDPHPRTIVHGEAVPLLTTPGERADVCETFGIDRFIVLPFSREMAATGPADFVREILVDRVGMGAMVIGHDHAFGRDREGGHELLESLGRQHGFDVEVIPPLAVADQVVSSSKIRRELSGAGDVARAAKWLGRHYTISGRVVRGAQRGRTLGFPTANLQPSDSRKLVPALGVYAVRAIMPDGSRFPSMMNIGRRPTFEGTNVHLEVHLLNFAGDLYDRALSVEFVERMRPERRFASIEALVAQLREDRERCNALFSSLN